MKSLFHQGAWVAALGVAMLGAGAASAAMLPPVHQQGSVQYLSGGIGHGESTAVQAASKNWPLTLEFAVSATPRAEYAANVNVVVHDAKGQVALKTEANGPFMLVRTQPGRYSVDATLQGKTLHETVVVKPDAPAKALFLWPAGTNGAMS